MPRRSLLRFAWLIVFPPTIIGVAVMKELGRQQRAASANYDAAKRSGYARFYSRWAEVNQVPELFGKHEVRAGAQAWTIDDVKRAVPDLT